MAKVTLWQSETTKLETQTGSHTPQNTFDYFFQNFQLTPLTIHLTDNITLKAIILEGDAKGLVVAKRSNNPSILFIKASQINIIKVR